MYSLVDVLLVVAVAALTAIAALLASRILHTRKAPPPDIPDPVSFLFEDGVLHHATRNALQTYALMPGAHVWSDIAALLTPRFPDVPKTFGNAPSGRLALPAACEDDPGTLVVTWRDSLCWVELDEGSAGPLRTSRPSPETDLPRILCNAMDHPAWEVTATGEIGWCNAAYRELCARVAQEGPKPLFPDPETLGNTRVSVTTADGTEEWFDLQLLKDGPHRVVLGNAVTPLVAAETAQSTFVQTLAKTFAHLSIGLAIFDRDGQLAIFNPALVDLTGLRPTFLATRPTMHTFFDQLREHRCMPEPRNYAKWRTEIARVIAAASGDDYLETWTLEDGRTFSVQGRPHPEGATAFLIKDISPEITLTRNFRTELEQYEILLDSVDEALAIFSTGGILTYCNAAYCVMWGQDPDNSFAEISIHDAIKLWQNRTAHSAAWEDVTRIVSTLGPRDSKLMTLRMRSGVAVQCDVLPIRADATLIRFKAQTQGHSRPRKQATDKEVQGIS